MNLFNIENSFNEMEERGWDKLYWCVDFHGTVAVADYGDPSKMRQFYPYAKEVLKFLTKKKEICLILWTCSHRDDIQDMIDFTEDNGIKFDYVNENPECASTQRANFSQKLYYTTMLDDRAGFEPETDWLTVGRLLEKLYGETIL